MTHQYFLTRFKFDKDKEKIWKVLSGYLQRYIPANGRVLDIGSGWCYFINQITAGEKYALEMDKFPLSAAGKDVNAIQADASRPCFRNDVFDVIFASNILEHLPRKRLMPALREYNNILKSNGSIIIISPNFKYCYKNYFEDYTHESILTDKSMKDMLIAAGFTISKIAPKFLPFSADSVLPVAISRRILKLYLMSPWKPFAGQMLIIAKKNMNALSN